MNDIGERIKYVRTEYFGKKISMAKFAESIGVTSGAVAQWETMPDRNPSTSVVKMISNVYGVSEEWLLTGEGEMKAPVTRESEIADLAAKLYGTDPNSFEYRVAMYLKDLPVEDWRRFEAFIRDMAEKVL